MLIFLDTEFTNLAERELISIALVSEDGQRVFYRERLDFDQERCSGFVQAKVLPLLGRCGHVAVQGNQLSEQTRTWFSTLPRSVVIACDSEWDWQIFGEVIGHPLPANITGRFDLRPLIDTAVFHHAVCRYHDQSDRPWHHALHDAYAHRAGWLAWHDARRQARRHGGM